MSTPSQLEHSDVRLFTHEPGTCYNLEQCPIHMRTEHEYRDFPQVWYAGKMWRLVNNDLFPDPDAFPDFVLDPLSYEDETLILKNAAYCPDCEVEIESTYTHDFQSCPCGHYVDGGHSYIRRTAGKLQDRSITIDVRVFQ